MLTTHSKLLIISHSSLFLILKSSTLLKVTRHLFYCWKIVISMTIIIKLINWMHYIFLHCHGIIQFIFLSIFYCIGKGYIFYSRIKYIWREQHSVSYLLFIFFGVTPAKVNGIIMISYFTRWQQGFIFAWRVFKVWWNSTRLINSQILRHFLLSYI